MNKNKKLWEKILGLKGLASVGVTDIVGSGMGAIFWFYIASAIEVEQYGEISYFLGIAALVQTVACVATANVMTVYVAKKIRIETTVYFISLIISFISSIILFFILYRLDVSLLILAFVINDLTIASILGKRCYSSYSKFIIIQKILLVSIGIVSYNLIGVEGIIFSLVISYTPFIFIMIKDFKNSKIDFRLLIPRKEFVLNNYVIMLAANFRRDIDKLLIPFLLGFTILGNYSLALQIFYVLTIFSNIVYKYLLPEESVKNSTKTLKKMSIIITCAIGVSGFFVLPEVIPVFFPEYVDTISAIRIMSLSVIPSNLVLIFWSKFFAAEKSRVVLFSSIIQMLVMIFGVLILGPMYGIIGLAVTHLTASTSQALFLVFSNKIILFRKNNGNM
jgi:O-antigen/teichoic acid export membrane protein